MSKNSKKKAKLYLKEAVENNKRAGLVEALTREFANVYLVDLQDNSYELIRMDELFRGRFTGVLQPLYSKSIRKFAEDAVYSHDREEFLHKTDIDFVREILASQDEFSFTFRVANGDSLQYYRGKFVRIGGEDEPPKRAIIGFANIQKEREEEIRHQKQLEEALERARRADNAKSAFLSNMSHDIRTPMTSILGLCAVASEHAEDPKRVRECLAQIRVSGDHLLQLIGNILDMTRIESGRLDLDEEWNDLPKILREAGEMISPLADEKIIELTVRIGKKVPPLYFCDRVRLTQLLVNLLSNAVKYTPEGGKVVLEADIGVRKPDFDANPAQPVFPEKGLLIRVKDNGMGIQGKDLSRIFDPFERESNSTMSGVMGTGLGLPICKGIVDSMKGTISVWSKPGKGSTFRIWLPLPEMSVNYAVAGDDQTTESGLNFKEPSQVSIFGVGRRRETNTENTDASSVRLLLVEDNTLNREIVAELLEVEGYQVETAKDGAEALERICRTGEPEISAVLMDLQMPVMDGYEATRRIRALPDRNLSNTPVIALTADAFEADRKRCREAEMDAYIPKPVEMESIRYVLNHVL